MAMNAPVFIVGCPRSGTSFLYHLLLSAGGFAEFRTQMNVFDVLEPIYRDLGLLKNKKKSLLAAGIYWEWIVRKGRKLGAMLGSNYMEVRYEELVSDPRKSLVRVSEFIQHDLDYDRILQARVGSVKNPLTSFKEDLNDGSFTPVGRWRNKFPPEQLARFERLVGDYLLELGYPLSGT